MRFHPWFATGLSLLLASRADAAGPRLQQERHWLFGHRCGVSFEADGPRPWLVPNESFEVEGFASAWSDPLDGTLLLYTDGRDVWRGSDHQRIHQGAAGALGIQPAVVGASPGVGPDTFFLLTTEAPTTRYVMLDLQGVHTRDFLVLSQYSALAVFARAAASEAAVAFEWTTPVEPYPRWATEGAATAGSLLRIGYQAQEHPATRNDGPTVSSSWAGDRAVFLGVPGHVAVSRGTPSDSFGFWDTTHQFEMLDAGDTTGSVHHTMLSPDGTKLYVGIDDGVAGDRADVVQVDLATGAKTLLGRALGRYAPSFGRGLDGIVYVGSAQPDDDVDVLGAITQPNASGAAAGFAPDALPLAPGCDVRRGLTNFVTGGMRLLDTDRDGAWDGQDVDNDQDGILDSTEGGAEFYDGDYEATGLLAWNRAGATTCAVGAGAGCAVLTAAVDPDADGLPSPDDLDSDGDGLPDLWECGGLGLDLDDDGRVDGAVQNNGGLAVAIARAEGGSTLRCGDADDDGLVNVFELDSDGDGLGDREEASGSTGLDDSQSGWAPAGRAGTRAGMQRDVDGDSVPDWLDALDDRVQDAGTDSGPDGDVDDGGMDAGVEDAGADATPDATPDDGAAPATPDAASSAGPSPSPGSGATPDDASTKVDGGGCSCDSGPGAPAGSALAFVVAALLLRRRPRRARAVVGGVVVSLAVLACGTDDELVSGPAEGDASTPERVELDAAAPEASPGDRPAADAATDAALEVEPDADAAADASVEDASPDASLAPRPGDLDPTFTPWSARWGRTADGFGSVAVDTTGRIVAAGWADHGHVTTRHLVRYLPDGTLDLSFGNGDVIADEEPHAYGYAGSGVGIATNGAVYTLFNNGVRRFDANGVPDGAFDVVEVRRTLLDDGRSMVVEPDGSFVVLLYDRVEGHSLLRRFAADGEPDADWAAQPLSNYELQALVVLERNGHRAYAAMGAANGRRDLLMLDERGELDPTFANEGVAMVTGPAWSGPTFQLAKVDAGWMVCGSRLARTAVLEAFLLARLDDEGALDPQFGQGGISASASRDETACALRADSTAVTLNRYGSVRHFDAAGRPNEWAGPDGIVTDAQHWPYGLAVQPADGRVILVGATNGDDPDAWLTRVRRLGDVDQTFGSGAVAPLNFGQADTEVSDAVRLAGGRLLAVIRTLIGHRRDVALVRFDATGQLDPTFGDQGYVRRSLRTGVDARIFVEDDGSLFFAGDFTATPIGGAWLSAEGQPIVRPTRYDARAEAITAVSGNRFISAYASDSVLVLARRLSTGAADTTYRGDGYTSHAAPGYPTLELGGLSLGADDAMLFALNSTTYSSTLPPAPRWSFLRVLATGLNDSSFGVAGWKTLPAIAQGQLARMRRSGDSLWVFGTETGAPGVRFALAKMDLQADPDAAFAELGVARSGALADAYASDFTFRGDGSVTGAGCVGERMATVRWSSQGVLDATWGASGVARVDAFGEGSCATHVVEAASRTWLFGRRTQGHAYEAVMSSLVR